MRRKLVALALSTASLTLVAARCASDDDIKLKADKKGDAAAQPLDEAPVKEPSDDPGHGAKAAPPKEAADDMFRDPLDGPGPSGADGADGAKVDDSTILDDSSTFDPGAPPGAVSPDGPIEASPPEGTPPELPPDPVHDAASDLDATGAPDLTQ